MAARIELAELIEQFTGGDDGGAQTAIPALTLFRATAPTEPIHMLYKPAFCVIAQGAKRVMMGERVFEYDSSRYLVISVDVPIASHLTRASPEQPYLSLRYEIDPGAVAALMLEAGLEAPREDSNLGSSLRVSELPEELVDACARLVRLLAKPQDTPVLAPLIEREILYRLLTGDQAARLRQIARADSRQAQINRAIHWLKENYRAAFRIDDLAAEARMSASALHQHFKAVTAMSPLQYQKQMRLQEARRLILSQGMDAAGAAHDVGYESPSQFSREYRRLFGDSPLRDVARLRDASPSLRDAAA